MGTPLAKVIEAIGGGPRRGRQIKAVLSGVATGIVPASQLDVPVSYEGLTSIGGGLGSAGFLVLDDTTDMAALAAGVARFLAVESCGQCLPCKLDGINLSERLAKVSASDAHSHDHDVIRTRLETVADRSRCYLATQQQVVVGSILEHFGDEIAAHVAGEREPVEPELVAELLDIRNGQAYVDGRHRRKQPDWTYDKEYSQTVPVELYSARRPPWRA